jgi:hypothetical protein
MIAKLNSYDPESGRCTINLGGRVYEFDGASEIIKQFHTHANTPIPTSEYLDGFVRGAHRQLLQDLDDLLVRYKAPMVIA